jgi:adenosylcobalamin-dependent ribonucleoside-triphosphate reductase
MTPELIEKVGSAALNNCGFCSTMNIDKSLEESTKPFTFLMDMSMLGVGIGFDVKGAGKIKINEESNNSKSTFTFIVPDTREGWVDSVKELLLFYFDTSNPYKDIQFDYSLVRPFGAPIKTFGGVASGHKPLEELHNNIKNVLNPLRGKLLTETAIVDIMNMIGVCVVAGNVRRTAEIAFGSSEEFMDLKNYEKNPQRMNYGWTSNNTIFAERGQDYSEVSKRIMLNGEPGLAWLKNMQNYGRMCEAPNYKDIKALGGNPCLEQTLESYELCCLVETFPTNHDSIEDYLETLKYAYLYAKTVTLVPTHNEDTNEVMLRNRRIGLSQSGVAMYIDKFGIEKHKQLCMRGYETIQYYDGIYSDWFKIPKSIKTTSIKPSGTVSLLAGVTPGMHYPESNYYIRRIRIGKHSNLIDSIQKSGYKIEDDSYDKSSYVVEIPINIEGVRQLDDVSMWEQVALASYLQEYWADNQVSCTVTFRPNEAKDIASTLNYFQYKLKGISFLPKTESGAYVQMPYEAITKEQFEEMNKNIKPIDFNNLSQDSVMEKYCDSDSCTI